jgi:hypothetical protein
MHLSLDKWQKNLNFSNKEEGQLSPSSTKGEKYEAFFGDSYGAGGGSVPAVGKSGLGPGTPSHGTGCFNPHRYGV